MTTRPRWRHPVSRGIGTEGTQLALDCARNVLRAIDRRSPEAGALAAWLAQHARVSACRRRPFPAMREGSAGRAAASANRTGA